MLNDMLTLLAPTPEMQEKVNGVIRDFITHKKCTTFFLGIADGILFLERYDVVVK
ncbi:MAG: hypothetical protein HWD58_18285 [Bacteroidota bacterium]|nr:MAG: hypothetical protein HWD58_18285 [Bacteroidota bacterium]